MVLKNYEERLLIWRRLRDQIDKEGSIQLAIDFWNNIPLSSRNIDPYDSTTWPSPWELIEDNSYCEYTKILAIGYTLMLTDKFKDWHYEVRLGVDRKQAKMYYILVAGDYVLCFDQENSIQISILPKSIRIEQTHVLSEQF
jgi:hypothetical protein